MTIALTTARNDYIGNGTQTNFAYTFRIFDDEELEIYVAGAGQTLGIHYSVTGVGSETGGTITFLSAPAVGASIDILSRIALTQDVNYIESDNFPAISHETALDKLTRISQEFFERISRCAKRAPWSTSTASLTMPEPEANKVIGWNPTASGLVNRTPSGKAEEVEFLPDGDLSSTNVQAAVVELRNDTDVKFTGKTDVGHTHSSAQVTDVQTAVSSNADVAANTSNRNKLKVSSLDSTADFLENKIIAGANINLTKINPGGNEKIEFSAVGGGAGGAGYLLASVAGISALTAGTTNIYTVPLGKSAIITHIAIVCTAAAGVTTAPAVGVGIAAGEDDIMVSQILTGLTAVNKIFQSALSGITKLALSGEIIKLGIDSPANGTLMTMTVRLYGEGI